MPSAVWSQEAGVFHESRTTKMLSWTALSSTLSMNTSAKVPVAWNCSLVEAEPHSVRPGSSVQAAPPTQSRLVEQALFASLLQRPGSMITGPSVNCFHSEVKVIFGAVERGSLESSSSLKFRLRGIPGVAEDLEQVLPTGQDAALTHAAPFVLHLPVAAKTVQLVEEPSAGTTQERLDAVPQRQPPIESAGQASGSVQAMSLPPSRNPTFRTPAPRAQKVRV